jgi:hypothetical protein
MQCKLSSCVIPSSRVLTLNCQFRNCISCFFDRGIGLKTPLGRDLRSQVKALVRCILFGKLSMNSSPTCTLVSADVVGLGSSISAALLDTMGYAFTFPVVSWFAGIPVGAYIHYPTISTDMISRVRTRTRWHSNSETVSSSHILSTGKLLQVLFRVVILGNH